MIAFLFFLLTARGYFDFQNETESIIIFNLSTHFFAVCEGMGENLPRSWSVEYCALTSLFEYVTMLSEINERSDNL